ncbi:MAG TPA: large conductance mechanosensitive channel protein MscL [Candidatus Paceibacterota bacterium]|nr:large conductance mechanosensitive channel protein MscL [Candidatus Paceibacterota bacterium]
MLKGFKEFILRGNVVDLAVGVVVGASFNSVVQALVKDLMTPLIAAVIQQPDFSAMVFTVNGSKFLYGEFINAIVSFLIVAVSVYFFVVLPLNKLTTKFRRPGPNEPKTRKCPECLSEIPAEAKRCAFCTAPVGR